ncbi:MAG: hypothetical protein II685_06770 [Clostridia bacterium]|nr:hypothetical protein [Clostridia bacterium]
MITYKLTEDNIFNETLGSYAAYGIEAFDDVKNCSVVNIPDIFPDKSSAEKYIELFNKEKLDLIHLENVIENIIQLG